MLMVKSSQSWHENPRRMCVNSGKIGANSGQLCGILNQSVVRSKLSVSGMHGT